ncbi:MAG: phosphoenolpyruvate synthase, partial [Deltaproteobacteria bacterium]|nr:phosphoenolpyruvate synthase [Deltaproteobacteria bacterium]
MNNERLVIWFDELQLKDIPEVGGKNASLGEMRRNLQKKGVNIPDGYAITAAAYRHLIKSAGIWDKIKEVLKDLDTHDMNNLSTRGKKV